MGFSSHCKLRTSVAIGANPNQVAGRPLSEAELWVQSCGLFGWFRHNFGTVALTSSHAGGGGASSLGTLGQIHPADVSSRSPTRRCAFPLRRRKLLPTTGVARTEAPTEADWRQGRLPKRTSAGP
jgi:hypothetical protein